MNLLELNDAILYGKKKEVSIPVISSEDLQLFKRTIATSAYIKKLFESTDDANSFFAVCADIKQVVGAKKCVECFYACKTGFYMKGIPAKLVYILQKVVKEYGKDFPNMALNGSIQYIKPYVNCLFVVDDKQYDVKDVIENIYGKPIKLINTSVRKVDYGSTSEVYVSDVERVAIMPDGISGTMSQEDCEKLTYCTEYGIMLGDIPVRTLGNRLGITKDDFDLRECI
jgi:hypothetical protein